MLPQDRLPILMSLYGRKLGQVASAAQMPKSTVCELVNCRRLASREQVLRIEAAIIGQRTGDDLSSQQMATAPTRVGA